MKNLSKIALSLVLLSGVAVYASDRTPLAQGLEAGSQNPAVVADEVNAADQDSNTVTDAYNDAYNAKYDVAPWYKKGLMTTKKYALKSYVKYPACVLFGVVLKWAYDHFVANVTCCAAEVAETATTVDTSKDAAIAKKLQAEEDKAAAAQRIAKK